jgi:hypothetical protein
MGPDGMFFGDPKGWRSRRKPKDVGPVGDLVVPGIPAVGCDPRGHGRESSDPIMKARQAMKRSRCCVLLVALLFVPAMAEAGALSEEDFQAKTTQNILNLCTASPEDPLFAHAVNFCHGYLVGAFHYYLASVSGPEGKRFVCPPDPRPSRNETIRMFTEWVKMHPEFWNDPPVESEFRFLSEIWSCNP